MSKTRTNLVAIAVAVVGSIATISPATATEVTKAAAKEAAATVQMGILATEGTLTAGGAVNYRFYFNTVTNGQLIATGSIASANKSKKWSVKLPVYTNTLVAGSTRVTGPSVSVPTNFTGDAVMTVTTSFKGKKVATRSVGFTISAAVVAGSVSTNLYGVGFENSVVLNAGIVSTYGMGATPTYSWTQTGGKTVTLSSTGSITPSFTTDALTNFVEFASGSNLVPYSDSQTLTNMRVQVVGMDDEQSVATTYSFKVLVTGNSITRTGLFSVACANVTPGHPNLPVGALVSFKNSAVSTNWTLLSKPSGSAAVLTHASSLMPQFRADVEGVYAIKDVVTGKISTNTAATWTGYKFCAICHGPDNNVGMTDLVTTWQDTKHASFFKNAINGLESSHYSSSCINCHVVGYDKDTNANNGGFDDVAKTLGWTFPSTLTTNNYAAMPDALKDLANIQCESCHGPGSRHPGSPSISVDVKVCATCHQDGSHHVRPEQWANGPHSSGYSSVSLAEGTNPSCARCHAPNGFLDVTKRINAMIAQGTNAATAQIIAASSSAATGTGPLACQTCHDPHDTYGNDDRHQLRVYDTVVIGALGTNVSGSVTLSNQGASAACMICHNSRRLPMQLSSGTPYYKSVRSGQISGPHESPVAEIFSGTTNSVIDYGVTLGSSFHTYLADCQACHMYKLKAGDTILTNDTKLVLTSGNLANYANLVGDHTFKMDYELVTGSVTNVIDNIAACNQCHTEPVTTFDFVPVGNWGDVAGDGAVEGVQTATQSLLDKVRGLLNATGVVTVTNALGEATGFYTNGLSATASIKDAQLKAAWNWMMFKRDGSRGVHNTQFTIKTLQSTYTDLSTNYYGNSVTNTFKGKYPNAFLR